MNYKEIVDIIEKAKKDYYQTGTSELTDAEYDNLVEQAKKLGYVETVGSAPVDKIAKIEHEHPMLSLDKVHSEKEVVDFLKDRACVMMHKADGLTISCTYEDGVLTRLETRGNGQIGNDIMFHAPSIGNLPKTINKDGKYVIDGECVILNADFEKLANKENYSNPRNLAAGSLSLLDAAESAKRHLKFYAWDVIEGGSHEYLWDNLIEARDLGFHVVDFVGIRNFGNIEVKNAIDRLRKDAQIMGFPIDGVVIKYDDIAYGRSLGATEHHMRNAIAYKFEDDRYSTKLKSVTWQVGKTGQITPVANFEPVEIDGSIVEKASLHNISIMRQLGLTNGCTVYVYKANMIIPQIDSAEPDGDGEIEIPAVCPVCGAPTRIARDDKDGSTETLVCTNKNCGGKLLGLWKTFVSKKGLDISGLSEKTLEQLLRLNYLTDKFESIYKLHLHRKDLCKLEGFGTTSVNNLLEAIEESKNCDMVHFITAFSIPGVGEGQAKWIAAKYKTVEGFINACENHDDFSKIINIGEVLNGNIHKWWKDNRYNMLNVALLMKFKEDAPKVVNKNSAVYGKTFVVTGAVNHFKNRDELKEKIESLGGKVSSSVSRNTDYLINNDVLSTSGKNKKAKELGVAIISEDAFLKMIGDID